MHNHKHHCICPHQNIKFCTICQRPYCVDCGKEWYAQNWSYRYPYTYTYTTLETPKEPEYTTITCSHTQ